MRSMQWSVAYTATRERAWQKGDSRNRDTSGQSDSGHSGRSRTGSGRHHSGRSDSSRERGRSTGKRAGVDRP